MASSIQNDDELIGSINVTPFVDIALVLLVIFMVTSSYIAKAALTVELPKAASAGSAVETTLNLVLTREGELHLDGEAASAEAIGARIAAEAAKNPNVQAVIAADRKVDYGRVVQVIDLVKQNGVTHFALNIEREAR